MISQTEVHYKTILLSIKTKNIILLMLTLLRICDKLIVIYYERKRLMKKNKTKDMSHIALFAALFCVCSWISIPATVPSTLQTFALYLSILLLGGRKTCNVVFLYIFLGISGFPVFSGMRGGISAVLDVTGGYIAGFAVVALFLWLTEKIYCKNMLLKTVFMALATLILYLFGAFWSAFVYSDGGKEMFLTFLISGSLPFIVPDAAKLFLAVYLSKRLSRFI